MDKQYKSVPSEENTIDLSRWEDLEDTQKQALVEKVRASSSTYGGFFIAQCSHDAILDSMPVLLDFFHASEEEKRKCTAPNSHSAFRGYWGLEEEDFSSYEHSQVKVKASMACMRFGPEGDKVDPNSGIFPNCWPDHNVFPAFRNKVVDAISSFERLHERLCKIFSRLLNIDLDVLHSMSENYMLRVNYHPAVALKEDQIRHPLHQDFTLFTLVCATKCPGPSLQLQINDEFLNVEAAPEKIWVQTGKVLEQVTNGHIPATMHRVIGTYEEIPAERISLAYLKYPLFSSSVVPLPNYILDGEEARKPTTYGEMVNKQVASSVRQEEAK